MRDLARNVAGDAPTAYAAVNRVESFLRKEYIYDEAPPYPTSLPDGATGPADRPPIVDFLFVSRRGFCQHFAGAMAVMLRSIGIPARVAVGYGTGHWDNGRKQWVVLDRDAHSWVEVWFPGRGWLPFDPTPGRSAPNPASVSSPDYAPSAFDIDLGGIEKAAVAPTAPDPGPQPEDPAPEQPQPQEEAASSSPAGAAAGRRGRGRCSRWSCRSSPSRRPAPPAGRGRAATATSATRVIAAARDLEGSLRALGWEPPAAGTPTERAADVLRMTGVDPSDLYGRAARARYGDGPLPAGSGEAAWREAGRLRRAIRRRASLGRRARAAFAIRLRRGTVTT